MTQGPAKTEQSDIVYTISLRSEPHPPGQVLGCKTTQARKSFLAASGDHLLVEKSQ